MAADKHGFTLLDPLFKPVARVFCALYQYHGSDPVTVALANLALYLGQPNSKLDGTDLAL